MENLDQLSESGLAVRELNRENLLRSDWSQTALGPHEEWPENLACIVNTCVLPMPHCAALFWGTELTVVHNLAWGKARGNRNGQGTRACDSYAPEALGTLGTVYRGRTVKVAARYFLEQGTAAHDDQLLLSTVTDREGRSLGVLAQLLENLPVDRYMPIEGLNRTERNHPGRQLKAQDYQTDQQYSASNQADSQQTSLFQRFAELLPTGLAILDKDAEAVFVNDGFFKLTTNKGHSEFRAWPESIHSDDYDRVMKAYRKAFESRETLQIEFRCVVAESKDAAAEPWRLFLLKPLSRDSQAGFISAIIDITEIKQAQLTQERAAQEARERKEQQERFIDMVSHEIRNPLSAVLHLAEEVKEVTREIAQGNEDIKDHVADILDAADTILLCVSHQNTLVDDILSFSKLDSMMLSLVPRETRPKWEFSQALRVFNSEFKAKNIKFHYAMDVSYEEQNVGYVVADLNRMKQVLVNLITNSIKFTARKKGERKITVSLGASVNRPTSYPPNVIFFSEDKDQFHIDSTMTSEWGSGDALYLMVAVQDTGIGISRDDQAKLFERFRQATPKTQEKYGGSGLGLFISRKLCTLHGGDIGVSAKEGEGSTFGFFFKVRRSSGTSDGGRPPFQSRSSSETSVPPTRADTGTPFRQRPSFSRGNSNLQSITESQIEQRPDRKFQYEGPEEDMKGILSGTKIGLSDMEPSLLDPPTEHIPESLPGSTEDHRYKETRAISEKYIKQVPELEKRLPDLKKGETYRQETDAKSVSRSQSDQRSEMKQTLLLVEDNIINQKVLRRQLQSRGFEVFTADNGQEAIDAVAERGKVSSVDLNNRNYFDCILMDQEMPVKDGNTATQEIRQLQADGKAGYSHILGVSANVRDAQTQSMRDAGMDDVISKPFKVDDLLKKVRNLVLDGGLDRRKKNKDGGEVKQAGNEGERKRENKIEGTCPDRRYLDHATDNQKIYLENDGREGESRGGERSRSRQSRT